MAEAKTDVKPDKAAPPDAPDATDQAADPGPRSDDDDWIERDLREAEEAEQAATTTADPAEAKDEQKTPAEQAAPAATDPEPDDDADADDQRSQTIPRARFDQVNAKRRKAEEDLIAERAKTELLERLITSGAISKEAAAKAVDQDEQLAPEDVIARARQEIEAEEDAIDKLYTDYEAGEGDLSLAQIRGRQRAVQKQRDKLNDLVLEHRTAAVAERVRPDSTDLTRRTDELYAANPWAVEFEGKHPEIIERVSQRAQEDAAILFPDARGDDRTLKVRELAFGMARDYAARLGFNVSATAAPTPTPQGNGKATPAQQKLAQAAAHPPNLGSMGTRHDSRTASLDAEKIAAMSHDDLAKLSLAELESLPE